MLHVPNPPRHLALEAALNAHPIEPIFSRIVNRQGQRFITSIKADSHFHVMFGHLPGVCFFVKDTDGRFVVANASFLHRVGIADEAELVGKTDEEVFPSELAEVFQRGDREVIETGLSVRNRVEMILNAGGVPEWYVTNKMPVLDKRDKIIGVMGTVQNHTQPHQLPEHAPILKAAASIRARLGMGISIAALAKSAGISPRHFSRRFRAVFSVSPQEFIVKTRVQIACGKLRSEDTELAEISVSCGFCDQSDFGRQFRKHTGITPRRYRLRYQLS